MKTHVSEARRGFSLVELLAVVLVLAVLAAVAVPLYLNTRKTAAARTCHANITAIAAAESAYATRFGAYVSGTLWSANYTAGTAAGAAPSGGLIGAPEGLTSIPTCPLNGASYSIAADAVATDPGGSIVISCPNAAQHETDTGTTSALPWTKTVLSAGNDTTNPL